MATQPLHNPVVLSRAQALLLNINGGAGGLWGQGAWQQGRHPDQMSLVNGVSRSRAMKPWVATAESILAKVERLWELLNKSP